MFVSLKDQSKMSDNMGPYFMSDVLALNLLGKIDMRVKKLISNVYVCISRQTVIYQRQI